MGMLEWPLLCGRVGKGRAQLMQALDKGDTGVNHILCHTMQRHIGLQFNERLPMREQQFVILCHLLSLTIRDCSHIMSAKIGGS